MIDIVLVKFRDDANLLKNLENKKPQQAIWMFPM